MNRRLWTVHCGLRGGEAEGEQAVKCEDGKTQKCTVNAKTAVDYQQLTEVIDPVRYSHPRRIPARHIESWSD